MPSPSTRQQQHDPLEPRRQDEEHEPTREAVGTDVEPEPWTPEEDVDATTGDEGGGQSTARGSNTMLDADTRQPRRPRQ